MPPPPATLTFDLVSIIFALTILTLKVVTESRVPWATSVPILVFLALSVPEYNLRMFLDSTEEGVWGTEVTVGSRGEVQVGGLGTNPVGGMGNKVPQKLTTFLGLKVYLKYIYAKYVNNFIF